MNAKNRSGCSVNHKGDGAPKAGKAPGPCSGGTKLCTHCKRSLPHGAFSPHPETVSRLNSWCKDCCRESKRISAQRRRDRDKLSRVGGPHITARQWLATIGATKEERELVRQGVECCKAFEADMERRVRESEHDGYHNARVARNFRCAEAVMDEAGVHWRRQVALLDAVIRLAKEEGVSFAFTRASAWRQDAMVEVG